MKKTFLKFVGLAVLAIALLSLTTCDEWINDTIRVFNNSAAIIDARIEYDNGDRTAWEMNIAPGSSRNFIVSFYDEDKWGEITVQVYDYTDDEYYYSSGNIAENDWVTVVTYPNDF